ncbi:MAG: hypothetical protein ACK41E_00615 [Deinococcales bacterium]
MQRTLLFMGVAGIFSLAQAQTAYVDVPSCHWAVTAINIVSSGDKVTPAQNTSNAQNAVRQVFEGIQCGDPAWSKNFIAQAPSSLDALIKGKPLRSYTLTFGSTSIAGTTARVAANLSLTLASGVERRQAVFILSSDPKTAWRVNYASLAALNLAVFPK